MSLYFAALVAAFVLAFWEAVRVLGSVYQLFLDRSALADRESSRPSRLPGEGGHDLPEHQGRGADLFHGARLLSSRPTQLVVPAVDHDRAEHRSPQAGSLFLGLAVPFGVIDPSPNLSAFTAGVELGVFVVLSTIGALLVVNWIVKTMRGSD